MKLVHDVEVDDDREDDIVVLTPAAAPAAAIVMEKNVEKEGWAKEKENSLRHRQVFFFCFLNFSLGAGLV